MHDTVSTTDADRTAIHAAKSWGLSQEEWVAYEADMAAAPDDERWIAEMEQGEAGDAAKQTANLTTSNTPF
jgi:hypothetical protein